MKNLQLYKTTNKFRNHRKLDIHWSAGCWDADSWDSLYSQLWRRSVRGREGVEQDDTGAYALSDLFRPAVFR